MNCRPAIHPIPRPPRRAGPAPPATVRGPTVRGESHEEGGGEFNQSFHCRVLHWVLRVWRSSGSEVLFYSFSAQVQAQSSALSAFRASAVRRAWVDPGRIRSVQARDRLVGGAAASLPSRRPASFSASDAAIRGPGSAVQRFPPSAAPIDSVSVRCPRNRARNSDRTGPNGSGSV